MADILNIKKEEIKYFICDICGKIRLIKNRNEILCEFTDEMVDESNNTRRYRNIDSLQVCDSCLSESEKDDLKERIDKLENELEEIKGSIDYLEDNI